MGKRSQLLVALLVAATAGTVVLGGCKPADSGQGDGNEAQPYPEQPAAAVRGADERAQLQPLKVEPGKIVVGVVSSCDPPIKTKATLTNRTSEAIEIRRLSSSCACTTAKLDGNKTIGPGESRTVEIAIDLSGIGQKSQSVYFVGPSGPVGQVRVDYEIVPPVRASVESVVLGEQSRKPEFSVVRTDGKPVKLKRLLANVGEIRTAQDGTQVVVLDLAKADRYAGSNAGQMDGSIGRDADGEWSTMYVLIETDYPGCPNAGVFVSRAR